MCHNIGGGGVCHVVEGTNSVCVKPIHTRNRPDRRSRWGCIATTPRTRTGGRLRPNLGHLRRAKQSTSFAKEVSGWQIWISNPSDASSRMPAAGWGGAQTPRNQLATWNFLRGSQLKRESSPLPAKCKYLTCRYSTRDQVWTPRGMGHDVVGAERWRRISFCSAKNSRLPPREAWTGRAASSYQRGQPWKHAWCSNGKMKLWEMLSLMWKFMSEKNYLYHCEN